MVKKKETQLVTKEERIELFEKLKELKKSLSEVTLQEHKPWNGDYKPDVITLDDLIEVKDLIIYKNPVTEKYEVKNTMLSSDKKLTFVQFKQNLMAVGYNLDWNYMKDFYNKYI